MVSPARHAPPCRREGSGSEGLRRAGAALDRGANLRLAQPLGRSTPRARRSPRCRNRPPRLRRQPHGCQRPQQSSLRSRPQIGSKSPSDKSIVRGPAGASALSTPSAGVLPTVQLTALERLIGRALRVAIVMPTAHTEDQIVTASPIVAPHAVALLLLIVLLGSRVMILPHGTT